MKVEMSFMNQVVVGEFKSGSLAMLTELSGTRKYRSSKLYSWGKGEDLVIRGTDGEKEKCDEVGGGPVYAQNVS